MKIELWKREAEECVQLVPQDIQAKRVIALCDALSTTTVKYVPVHEYEKLAAHWEVLAYMFGLALLWITIGFGLILWR